MTDKHPYEPFDDELLSAYVDGELTDAERATVEGQLRDDPQAREMVADLRAVSETLRSLPKHELGADLREAILQRAVVHPQEAPVERIGSRRWKWAVLALAAALMLTVYLPEVDHDEQHLAQAPPKVQEPLKEREIERAVSRLQSSAKEETSAVSLFADSSSAPLPASPDMLEGRVEFSEEDDEMADSDTVALGAAFDGTLQHAPIESAQIQPIGEVREEDYHIHLTPVSRRVGAVQFDQMLGAHGIVVRGQSSASPGQGGRSPATDASDKQRESKPADEVAAGEAQLVLVEAPLTQIQQIVASCSRDNSPWKSLRLIDQDGENSNLPLFVRQKSKADKPAEAGVAVVLDSLQLGEAPARGWAMHLGKSRFVPDQSTSTESESSRSRSLATLRVLFVLHPAEE